MLAPDRAECAVTFSRGLSAIDCGLKIFFQNPPVGECAGELPILPDSYEIKKQTAYFQVCKRL
jgi:hypothetical protein